MRTFMIRILIIGIVISSLVGCWDLREIEEMGFVMGVAMDPGEDNKQRTTYQIAIPEALKVEAEGSGMQQAYFNVTGSDLTDMQVSRDIATKTSRRANFEHLQVIILNQELVKEGLTNHLLDFFLRDHEMRTRNLVFISLGEAKSVFDTDVDLENMPAMYMPILAERHRPVLQMPREITMGDLASHAIGRRSYLVPLVEEDEANTIKIGGVAIFLGKTNTMIGTLEEEDIEGFNLVVGEAEQGVLEVPFEDRGVFNFEIMNLNSNISYERKQGEDYFQIHIQTEGLLAEKWIDGIEINNPKTLIHLEEAVEQEMKKKAEEVIQKMQEEYQADVFEFLQYVRVKEYNYWNEINEDWDGDGGPFSEANINVDIEAKIRNYMLNEKLERKDSNS
ncbi:Ger(x)C family spore germination protein [Salicibibacter kimchii]|uniref:Ger(X)C family spore germination protein n=1 Tax=Salicibibacter kimchii TaxID=2099786 RepID=A0A345C2K5_9BACI|nr:Ger(x)C family spore germination protein [Salicibibacter kimchii]AXF57436.1 Ger(x)C family spore germination protein [Salicibibacter kimchii]